MYSSGTRSAGSLSAASRARIRQTSQDSCLSIPCIRKNGAGLRSISGACCAAASFCRSVGALLARLGVVRLCLALLSGGAPAAPRQFSRLFGRSAAALLQHMVGEVQKLPADVLPAVQAHWSNPKAFRGMWQHLAAMPGCSADLARGTDDFGDTPVVVLSAGARHARWLDADARLARASSSGRHIVSPHSGHWVHLDDPDLVVQGDSGCDQTIVRRTRTDRRPCTCPSDRMKPPSTHGSGPSRQARPASE